MPRIDFDYLAKFVAALFIASIMGVIAAFAFGFYMIVVLFEVLFGY